MAKRDRTQAALDRLAAAVEDPHAPAARSAIDKALRDRSNLVVAAALELIYENQLSGFENTMEAAWAHAMSDPVRHDPGCRIKAGVVKALDVLCEPADELFLAGIRHVQPEPVWGGSQDTAVSLRGMCAIALVNRRLPSTMMELARLLGDRERDARRAAADAIAASGDALTGVPLLVLRVRAQDPEPEVLGACFAGLLSLDPEQTLEFVIEHLRVRDPLVVEAAALALGQSRIDAALEPLIDLAKRSFGEHRKIALLALSMLRSDAAWEHLLGLIRESAQPLARDAIEALSIYRELPSLVERVREAVAERTHGRELVDEALAESFGDH